MEKKIEETTVEGSAQERYDAAMEELQKVKEDHGAVMDELADMKTPARTGNVEADLDALAEYDTRRTRLQRKEAMLLDLIAPAQAKVDALDAEVLEEGRKNALLALSLAAAALPDALLRLPDALGGVCDVMDSIADAYATTEGEAEALRQRHGITVPPLSHAHPEVDGLARVASSRGGTSLGAIIRRVAEVADYVEGAEARATQREREQAERRAAQQRAYEAECLRGVHGPEERERVRAEYVADMRRMAGGGNALRAGVAGTFAQGELAVFESNAALNGRPVGGK